MKATRRKFIKTGIIAGAGIAMPGAALAERSARPLESPNTPLPASLLPTATPTRGIGVYPGAPEEDFSPTLLPDTSGAYRNLALLRPAFHSSSYDYNLTAQLVTDGLIDTTLPTWVTTVINGEIQPKHDRETLLNHFGPNNVELPGNTPVVEVHLGGGTTVPEIDRLDLFVIIPESIPPNTLLFTVFVSPDGHLWHKAGSTTGSTPLPTEPYPPDLSHGHNILAPSIILDGPSRNRFYRVEFTTADPASTANVPWSVGQIAFFHAKQRIEIGGPYSFTSAWKAAGLDEEWVYVDLGGRFSFDRIALHWIARAAEGKLQVSDDAGTWHDLQPLPAPPADGVDDIHLATPGQGRYVRLLLTRAATEHGYILSEMEIFGRGGFTAHPKPAASPLPDGRLDLAGGRWRLYRADARTSTPCPSQPEQNPSETATQNSKTQNSQTEPNSFPHEQNSLTGEALSKPGFPDHFWIPATVPGTTLTSYQNVGAIPDPNFGQNQLHISDSYFYADFWYRTEFTVPAVKPGQLQWLHLDGINWKADVYLNGASLGHIDGGFTRGRFDITGKVHPGKPNALAVRIYRNVTPGSCKQKTYESTGKNGGALGADNPTYHASIGWDWIPTVRGRNTGIWSNVYLTQTGAVTLEDPLVTSKLPLPGTGHADVSLEVFAVNHTAAPVTATLRGRFGTVAFEQRLTLAANERQTVKLSPATHHQLRIQNPQLWWPVGYGDPHLYDVDLRLESKRGDLHDRKQFKAGIRQMTADENGGNLHLFINGRRFIALGGNWGFGEIQLRYRAREYDTAVRYHREMNLNIIRDWVGQIGDDAFYEACDRHGVVVMQDFWLANPWDGPIPDDNAMFLANARDYLGRIRSHCSIGLYCGRNEWYPPKTLETGLKQLLAELHPDIHYIGSSADGPVSGHGPYHALTAPEYFRTADTKLHSEIGSPAIPPLDSIRAMMPEHAVWPQGLDWGLHDFTLQGAQGGTAFRTLISENYGGATNGEDWVALAQLVTYEAYRAMFEAQSTHRMGVLLWMSHPCWPSFVWQTYDYYFEPTAAYFGSKKGAEPLHIQWNSYTETIEVVNYSAGNVTGLTAEVEVVNLDGKSISKNSAQLNSTEDSVATPIRMHYPEGLTPAHFLRLTLSQNGTVRSTNFYLRGQQQGDLRALRTLHGATVTANTTAEQRDGHWHLTTTLRNTSTTPALFVRIKATREHTGDRILPAIYDDNYIALMPDETRILKTELRHADTRGETPKVVVKGFNVN